MTDGKKLKSAIFDMDGTLLDTECRYRWQWQEASRQYGFTLSDEDHAEIAGRGMDGALQKLQEVKNITLDIPKFKDLIFSLWEPAGDVFPLKPRAGALELLTRLHSLEIPLAVATSARTPYAEEELEKVGLKHFFHTIVGRDLVGKAKPDPDVYLLALEKLGGVASETLAVEDTVVGATAAVAAGLYTLLVPDVVPPKGECPAIAGQLRSIGDIWGFLADKGIVFG